LKALEEKFLKEDEDLGQNWDSKIKEYEEKSHKMEEELDIRHKSEMEALVKSLEQSLTTNMKFPPEYLNLRRSEILLAKQQRFKEADFAKNKRLAIEKTEIEKFNKSKNNKCQGKLEKLAKKQNLEKNAMRKKIESTIEIMQKEKKHNSDNLFHKYRNTKQELELQQSQESLLINNDNLMKKRCTTGKMPNKSALNFLGKAHSGIDPSKATGLKMSNNYSPQKNNINQDYETLNEKQNQHQEEFENHQNNENNEININSDNNEKRKNKC